MTAPLDQIRAVVAAALRDTANEPDVRVRAAAYKMALIHVQRITRADMGRAAAD